MSSFETQVDFIQKTIVSTVQLYINQIIIDILKETIDLYYGILTIKQNNLDDFIYKQGETEIFDFNYVFKEDISDNFDNLKTSNNDYDKKRLNLFLNFCAINNHDDNNIVTPAIKDTKTYKLLFNGLTQNEDIKNRAKLLFYAFEFVYKNKNNDKLNLKETITDNDIYSEICNCSKNKIIEKIINNIKHNHHELYGELTKQEPNYKEFFDKI